MSTDRKFKRFGEVKTKGITRLQPAIALVTMTSRKKTSGHLKFTTYVSSGIMLEAAVFCLIKVYSLKEKEYKHFHKITYTFEQTGLLNFNFNFF